MKFMVELRIQEIGSLEYKVGTFNEFKPLVSVNLFSDLFKEHVLILFQNFSILHMNPLRNIFGACNNTEGLLLNLRRELQELGCHQEDETKRLQVAPTCTGT